MIVLYLTGSSNASVVRTAQQLPLGLLAQPDSHYERHIPSFPVWAADNGCFGVERNGRTFDIEGYLAWLDSLPRKGCLFAVAPDVLHWIDGKPFGDAVATWERSAPILPRIRALGFPPAYVAQDGIDPHTVEWRAFQWLFIGGSDRFKYCRETRYLARLAHQHGVQVHVGRVNSWRHFQEAAVFADSCDGTYIKYGPDINLPKIIRWLRADHQPSLWEAA
jgi:hypothetical protein